MTGLERWREGGWRGWVAPAVRAEVGRLLGAAASGDGRRSRHARTVRLEAGDGTLWVKAYPAPDARRAFRAARMAAALRRDGFGAPETLLVGARGGEGVLVSRDVGGVELRAALTEAPRAAKRRLLRATGLEVGRLHEAGFVHGDLVPSNVQVVDDRIVFLDHDRTRHGRLLVWFGGRRNLVQLGRFVVPGISLSDRARVFAAYAGARGLGRRGRRRLARWLVGKTTARRCAIDAIAPDVARRAGFRELMRSGGPFDPARRPA